MTKQTKHISHSIFFFGALFVVGERTTWEGEDISRKRCVFANYQHNMQIAQTQVKYVVLTRNTYAPLAKMLETHKSQNSGWEHSLNIARVQYWIAYVEFGNCSLECGDFPHRHTFNTHVQAHKLCSATHMNFKWFCVSRQIPCRVPHFSLPLWTCRRLEPWLTGHWCEMGR